MTIIHSLTKGHKSTFSTMKERQPEKLENITLTGVFSGCQIVLDLTTSVPFKKKLEIKKKIIENGGIVSFIVTKKSTHVVGNDPCKFDVSYKCQMAVKYNIPVISPEFIWDAITTGRLPNPDDYIIGGKSKKSEFKSGKITASHPKTGEKKKANIFFSVRGTKVWKPYDKDAPFFDEFSFEIAKYAAFQGYKKKTETQIFYVLELHVADPNSKNAKDREFKFRICTHYGSLKDIQEASEGTYEYRYAQTADLALAIYSQLCKDQTAPSKEMKKIDGCLPTRIGSLKLQQMISKLMIDDESLAPTVINLVEHIWQEATGEVEDIIATAVSEIKLEQIEKAEAILLQIREAFDKSLEMKTLINDFYNTLQHTNEIAEKTTVTKAWLAKKQDLCQLIKDMVSVNEATNWSKRSSTAAKYRALRCRIEHMDISDSSHKMVKDLVESSIIGDLKIEIKSIYQIHRPVEDSSFLHDMTNTQLLFHASKAENFVGILSRGLLLPKIVVDDYGGSRTDVGMLGNGLYFASSASTSAKYSKASKTKGTRLMLINKVALGRCMDVYKHNTELNGPPEGYDSVHGVRKTDNNDSDFVDDEYVIYSLSQQKIMYLVEFVLEGDTITNINIGETEENLDEETHSDITIIDVQKLQELEDPISKVKSGLICDQQENAVDLKAVHVKARLVDLASEVIVMQEYSNNLDIAVEAKFIFPLDDMAAVCGFEAFINGKHIIGEVKEKETAHKEYKKAISEGHGAYLMDRDEETPDVFIVSVGNLPPKAHVLIKITYVAELQVEGEVINFRLPGSVAPWKENSAIKETTQTELGTHKVQSGKTTVQVSIDMPFNIHSLECPTHKLRIKRTDTKAVIETMENQSFDDGFLLLIGLSEIHVPRMWVENHPSQQHHQACMLTFYPEFEAGEQKDLEIVFLLDLSNSMKGSALEDAKNVLSLMLSRLPSHALYNIIVFGTAYSELFPVNEANTPSNTARARKFIMDAEANLGNTDVFQPLHSNYLLESESSVKNIFLISDGHINNEDAVLQAALNHAAHSRLFTCGVSSTSNVHLLRSLARVGGGAFEFFDRKAKSKWDRKVKNQLTKAAQPGLTSVSVEWRQFDEDPDKLPQAPRQITSLFSGSRQVVYGYVPNCTMATLKAVVGGQEVCTVVSTSDLSITEGLTVHRLTARAIIRDWEDGMLSSDRTRHEMLKMNLKQYIIDLSTEYSIVTQFTSFVAVEKRDEDEKAGKWTSTGPTMFQLVEQECADILPYLSWITDKDDIMEVVQKSHIMPLLAEKIEDDEMLTEQSDSESEEESEEEYQETKALAIFDDEDYEKNAIEEQYDECAVYGASEFSESDKAEKIEDDEMLREERDSESEEESDSESDSESGSESEEESETLYENAEEDGRKEKEREEEEELVESFSRGSEEFTEVGSSVPRAVSKQVPQAQEPTSQTVSDVPANAMPVLSKSIMALKRSKIMRKVSYGREDTTSLFEQSDPQEEIAVKGLRLKKGDEEEEEKLEDYFLRASEEFIQVGSSVLPAVSKSSKSLASRISDSAVSVGKRGTMGKEKALFPKASFQMQKAEIYKPVVKPVAVCSSYSSKAGRVSYTAMSIEQQSSPPAPPHVPKRVRKVSNLSLSALSPPQYLSTHFDITQQQQSPPPARPPAPPPVSPPVPPPVPERVRKLPKLSLSALSQPQCLSTHFDTTQQQQSLPPARPLSGTASVQWHRHCASLSEEVYDQIQMQPDLDETNTYTDVMDLINEQTTDGYWELKDDLDCLLRNILQKTGLSTLSPKVSNEFHRTLVTIMALLYIYEVIMPELFPLDPQTINTEWSGVKLIEKQFCQQWEEVLKRMTGHLTPSDVNKVTNAVKKGFSYWKEFDSRYPLIYYILELGPNWLSVIRSLICRFGSSFWILQNKLLFKNTGWKTLELH